MDKLVTVIDDCRYLKELDLSWNELPSQQMLDLTRVLATNRTLTFVNLSWNFLTCSDHADPDKFEERQKYKEARM